MYRCLFVYVFVCVSFFALQVQSQSIPQFQSRVLMELSAPVWAMTPVQKVTDDGKDQIALLSNPSRVLLVNPLTGEFQEIFTGEKNIMTMTERPTIDAGFISNGVIQDIVFCDSLRITALTENNGLWSHHVLYDLSDMVGILWGARVGNLIADDFGDEVLGIIEGVFDTSFANVYSYSNNEWNETLVYSAEVGMDSAIGELDSTRNGDEFVIATEMGPTYILHEPAAGWDLSMNPPINGFFGHIHWPISRISNDFDNSGWSAKIGDVDPNAEGNEIVYGNRYNNMISVLTKNMDGGYTMKQVFRGNWIESSSTLPSSQLLTLSDQNRESPGNMWDIALGDVLLQRPGLEIVGVDDTGSVYLIWNENNEWYGETIYQSSAPLFAVEIMDVDPSIPGSEIVVGGKANQVIILQQQSSHVEHWYLMQ